VGIYALEAIHELLHHIPNFLHHHSHEEDAPHHHHDLGEHHPIFEAKKIQTPDNEAIPASQHELKWVYLLLFWQKTELITHFSWFQKGLVFNHHFFCGKYLIHLQQNSPPPEFNEELGIFN
jgi:hypothetical protein